MERQVWKFPFGVTDRFSLIMPFGAELLHVETQHGTPCLWALVDPGAPTAPRHFRLAGTGHRIAGAVRYVGSFMLKDGAFVGHLFEVAP